MNGAPSACSSSCLQCGAVEGGRRVGPVRVHRLALDELALDRVERRQLVVLRLQRPHVGLDAEERAQEVLEMRPERDQEFGLLLAREVRRARTCGGESGRQRRVGLLQVGDEQLVDAGRARRRIEVRERETVRERQRSDGDRWAWRRKRSSRRARVARVVR